MFSKPKAWTAATLALSFPLLFSACASDGGKGDDNGAEEKTSKIHLSVLSGAAGFVASDVELSFAGVPVVDSNGKLVQKMTVAGDEAQDIVLQIKSLPKNAETLVVTAKAPGYLGSGQSILVPAKPVDRAVQLRMMKDGVGKLADGVHGSQLDISGSLDADGKVVEEITVATTVEPVVKVKIPVGVKLTDKDGNPVTDGVLKVIAFDPSKPRALMAYPGSMNVLANVDGFTGIDGNPASGKQQINFKTAGFTTIVIESADGRRVKNFSAPIEIAMQFPVGTKDADGNTVNVGDKVPIWSFDEETGEWSYEKEGTAADLDANDGLLDVVYDTTHLTSWNLDWHYSEVCTANINVIDSLGANQLALVDHFIVDIPDAPIYRVLDNYDPSDGNMMLFNVPVGMPATVTAYDANGVELGSVSVEDLCGGQVGPGGWNTDIDNEVDLVIDGDNSPADVSFTASCPTPGVNVPGFNSNTVPLPLVLSPTNGGANITLTNGSGQAGAGVYDLAPTSSSQALFNAIAWGSNGNQITVTAPSYTQNFVLTNAYCDPSSGTISGSELNPDINYLPRDVAKDSHGNLYISTMNNGILKFDGTNTTTLIAPRSSNSDPYPTPTPTSAGSVYTSNTVTGLDLVVMPNGQELLFYADTKAHCVNVVELNSGNVATFAGRCGDPGGNTPGTDVSTTTTPVAASAGGKLLSPMDVAYFPSENRLFISQKFKVKVVQEADTAPAIWDVAGRDDTTPADIGGAGDGYPDGSDAATTHVHPYMLDVMPNGDVVFSDGGHRLSKIVGINYAPDGDPAVGATLERVTGAWMDPGYYPVWVNSAPAADISTRYNFTRDVEIDTAGNIYFADHYNHRVRRILAATGVVELVAGFTWGISAPLLNQTGPVNAMSIWRPHGLWVENNGDFYLTQAAGVPYGTVRHVTY